ncbi:MAG: hypothetical protein ACI4F5_02390 [Acutalibacteraceae bacterium]
MISEYISFGNLTLQFNLPEKTAGKNLYEAFFCDMKKPDFVYNFKFCDSLPQPKKDDFCFHTLEYAIEKDEIMCRVYYKNMAEGGYIAVREQSEGSSQINVYLDNSVHNKLWTRIVLDTIGIEELAAKKGGFVFHSSFIEKDGRAVLFTGPCSAGKSTQADLWNISRKTPIINGDKTYIYIDDGIVYASGLPFSGSSGICKNKAMPLDFIVRLEKAAENKVEKLSCKEAFMTILDSCYVPPGYGLQISETAALIAQNCKICRLSCLPDISAVETLESIMEKEKSL